MLALTVTARWRWVTAVCRSSTSPAHAHQPMVDATLQLTLVFNGTIYNYRELRLELQARGYSVFFQR
jgi:asparagine synthetase B (glutamine-hydrolysing)